MTRTRLAAAAVVMALGSTPAAAQDVLRGAAVDEASGRAVMGAVASLLDSAGGVLARTLTDERGEFRLARTAAARRLELRRIGFRPRVVALPADGTPPRRVAMLAIATMLEPVRVADAGRCARRPDRERALGLWDRARDALLAAVVARDAAPEGLVRLRYDRVLQPNGEVVKQLVRVDSAETTAVPFSALRSGADFVRDGFVVEAPDGATFMGPDADVLLDESFARGYCFHVAAAERARRDQVGLAFTPSSRPGKRIDIEGVLWVDTLHRELRDIEFRYVGFPQAIAAARPGGRIQFRELPNGVVLVDRWSLRVAQPGVDTTWARNGTPVLRNWYDPRELGGEVARARWANGQAFDAPLGTLRVDGTRRDGTPAVGATIRLEDTDYVGEASDGGRVEIRDLLPGPYAMVVEDTALARVNLTIPLPPAVVAVRDSVTALRAVIPTAEDFVRAKCASARRARASQRVRPDRNLTAAQDRPALLLGRVMADYGYSADRVTWSINLVDGVDVAPAVARGVTGTDGLFWSCDDVARGSTVQIAVSRRGGTPIVVRLTLDQPVTVVPLPLPTGAPVR